MEYPIGIVHLKYEVKETIKGDPGQLTDLHFRLYGNPDDGVFKPGNAYLFLIREDGNVPPLGCSANTVPVIFDQTHAFAERLRQSHK
ncbi:hypothetical protein [Cupriavidus basilensis]|uniref:hypothetical protein n=1 Tax=Cupriavidus basilensis TaxID=68895 RepID=UPI0039F6FF22